MATRTQTPPRSLKDRGLKRLTFDVPVGEAEKLAALARATGYNKVTTMLRALRVLATLEDAERSGATITIKNPDGTAERLLLR